NTLSSKNGQDGKEAAGRLVLRGTSILSSWKLCSGVVIWYHNRSQAASKTTEVINNLQEVRSGIVTQMPAAVSGFEFQKQAMRSRRSACSSREAVREVAGLRSRI